MVILLLVGIIPSTAVSMALLLTSQMRHQRIQYAPYCDWFHDEGIFSCSTGSGYSSTLSLISTRTRIKTSHPVRPLSLLYQQMTESESNINNDKDNNNDSDRDDDSNVANKPKKKLSSRLAMMAADWLEEEEEEELNIVDTEKKDEKKKPSSRLAMLAEDWLDDEDDDEDDELLSYWGRFEDRVIKQPSSTSSEEVRGNDENDGTIDSSITTEERLDRYYDSRGINKRQERKHKTKIEQALDKAFGSTSSSSSGSSTAAASSLSQAIRILEDIQPLCQVNTRLGGQTLIELALLYWENEQYDMSLKVLQSLLQNTSIERSYVRKLIKQLQSGKTSPPRPPPPPPSFSRRASINTNSNTNMLQQMMMKWQDGNFFDD